MEKKNLILGILIFGSLWGAVEATLGGVLHRVLLHFPYNGAIMFSIAAFILVAARRSYGKPGAITAMGFVAASFKLLNLFFFTSPCIFHPMLAIIVEAMAIDLVLSISERSSKLSQLSKLSKLKAPDYLLGALMGSVGTLASASVLYIPPVRGVPPLISSSTVFLTFLSISVIGCAITVPLAFKFGSPIDFQRKSATANIFVIALCWMVGALSILLI